MKKLKFRTCLLLLSTFSLMSCQNIEKKRQDFGGLVLKWNKANSSKELTTLSQMYADAVLFYGRKCNKNVCIKEKPSFFKKNPNLYQKSYGEVEIESITEDEVQYSFVKSITANMNTKDYPSYLHLKKQGNDWRISVKGNLITDKNFARKKTEKKIPQNQKNYKYAPSVSVVYGTLIYETYFGPPGYGEHPETDALESYYMLKLAKPINVISDKKCEDEFDHDITYKNIDKIQLSGDYKKCSKLKNKTVKITGTFFGAFTGHHHSCVILMDQNIEEF